MNHISAGHIPFEISGILAELSLTKLEQKLEVRAPLADTRGKFLSETVRLERKLEVPVLPRYDLMRRVVVIGGRNSSWRTNQSLWCRYR